MSVTGSRVNWPTASNASLKSPWRWRPGRRCCCSTNRLPACRAKRAMSCSPQSPASRVISRCCLSSMTWSWCFALRRASSSWSAGGCSSRAPPKRSQPTRACAPSTSARPGPRAWMACTRKRAVAEPLLALDQVRAGYGPAVVLDGISLALPERGALAVLGRNGVGKSTLLLTIMGFTQVGRGRVLWQGVDIGRYPPHRRALAGIGWVAQEREIFASLSVEENLTVAARTGRWDLPSVYDLFPRLAERRRNLGNQLSGGEQQMLAIGRALVLNPRLLLLDEPLEGLAPILVQELLAALTRVIREEGLSAILVEQNAQKILSVTDRAAILERGVIVHESASAALKSDPKVLEEYLGVGKTKSGALAPKAL